jgi:hypothetical protein
MITKAKYIICAVCVICGFASCSDWDDHYENLASQAGSDMTLWQTMQQNPDLSDFCEVLSQTKVFKNHKVTDVSYAALLDGAQTFTVLAPVNGSFKKDSIFKLLETAQGDSMVVRSFIGNHLSYNQVANIEKPTDFFLLNNKRATIGNNLALNVPLKASNIRAKGGILHVLEKTLPYRHNIYEILLNDERYNKIGEQLSSYDKDEFNPSLSVEGGMVDGELVYVDSVITERNIMLERIGKLADEDSSYMVVLPTNDEWQRVWDEAMSHFRYDNTVIGADSLQRYWANYSLLNDAIFSRTIQASPEDSLVTYAYDRHYPQYHVFHNPFSESGILSKDNTTTQEYSNGTLYTAKKWPFTPEMTYKREIKTEGERTSKILANTLCSYNTRINTVDSISVSENEYLVITPSNMNANWTMTFNVENTLATNYDVCAIVLPPTIYNPKADLKSCRIQAEIIYVDEKGAEKIEKINTNLENDPTRVDTLVIKENFSFPVCNYGQTNNKIKVKLKCNILAGNKKYSREMFLDCIYLRPRKNMNTEQ